MPCSGKKDARLPSVRRFPNNTPVSQRDLDADDQVSGGAIAIAARSAVIGRDDAADRRAIAERRVERQRRTGQRPRSVRGHRGPLVEVREPVDVAQQRVRVRQQMVGEQDRLRGLHMRLAGHDRRRMRSRLGRKCRNEFERAFGHPSDRIAQPQSKQRGHLIVS